MHPNLTPQAQAFNRHIGELIHNDEKRAPISAMVAKLVEETTLENFETNIFRATYLGKDVEIVYMRDLICGPKNDKNEFSHSKTFVFWALQNHAMILWIRLVFFHDGPKGPKWKQIKQLSLMASK